VCGCIAISAVLVWIKWLPKFKVLNHTKLADKLPLAVMLIKGKF